MSGGFKPLEGRAVLRRRTSSLQFEASLDESDCRENLIASPHKRENMPNHISVEDGRKGRDIEAPSEAQTRKTCSLGAFLTSSLLHDFLIALGCLALALGLEAVTPRSTYVLKETLYWHSFPHKSNSVPSWTVPVYALLGPLALFLVHRFTSGLKWRETLRLGVAHCLAFFLTGAITNCLKIPVGRLRPNFISVCWPNGTMAFTHDSQWGGYAVCDPLVPIGEEEEVRKSWPSGHSSLSAAGMGFFSLYLVGQLRVFSAAHVDGRLWRFVLALLPSLGAVAVAVTRVLDYWHFPSDVLTGLAIGFVVAFAVYRSHYPPLTHPRCDRPWEFPLREQSEQRQDTDYPVTAYRDQ